LTKVIRKYTDFIGKKKKKKKKKSFHWNLKKVIKYKGEEQSEKTGKLMKIEKIKRYEMQNDHFAVGAEDRDEGGVEDISRFE
jgi:hypothetical protein